LSSGSGLAETHQWSCDHGLVVADDGLASSGLMVI
jgi:hypothetical protein